MLQLLLRQRGRGRRGRRRRREGVGRQRRRQRRRRKAEAELKGLHHLRRERRAARLGGEQVDRVAKLALHARRERLAGGEMRHGRRWAAAVAKAGSAAAAAAARAAARAAGWASAAGSVLLGDRLGLGVVELERLRVARDVAEVLVGLDRVARGVAIGVLLAAAHERVVLERLGLFEQIRAARGEERLHAGLERNVLRLELVLAQDRGDVLGPARSRTHLQLERRLRRRVKPQMVPSSLMTASGPPSSSISSRLNSPLAPM